MAEQATIQIQMDAEMLKRLEALYAKAGASFEDAVRDLASMSLRADYAFVLPKGTGRKTSAFGCLKPYIDPTVPVDEEGAFADAMAEKHREVD